MRNVGLNKSSFDSILLKVESLAKGINLLKLRVDGEEHYKEIIQLSEKNPFSYKETRLVKYLADGLQGEAIGKIEGMSHRTIEGIIARVRTRCGLPTQCALVAFFIRKGWIK